MSPRDQNSRTAIVVCRAAWSMFVSTTLFLGACEPALEGPNEVAWYRKPPPAGPKDGNSMSIGRRGGTTTTSVQGSTAEAGNHTQRGFTVNRRGDTTAVGALPRTAAPRDPAWTSKVVGRPSGGGATYETTGVSAGYGSHTGTSSTVGTGR